ncbi:hypothetical protein [Priestia megaterium]|uniref:hypothetical protein n=1 Tax=Priestia megaterium TaxID=1404 RepID=UPI0025A48A90|nr:hypothetical protein [Priestia megaterium]MDM8151633.1 hypothetical protein [Priestia megaterium]
MEKLEKFLRDKRNENESREEEIKRNWQMYVSVVDQLTEQIKYWLVPYEGQGVTLTESPWNNSELVQLVIKLEEANYEFRLTPRISEKSMDVNLLFVVNLTATNYSYASSKGFELSYPKEENAWFIKEAHPNEIGFNRGKRFNKDVFEEILTAEY